MKNSAPLRSLNMQKHKDSLMLFALHEDGAFKLWDLSDRSRLLSFNLQKDLMGMLSPFVFGFLGFNFHIKTYGLLSFYVN